MSHFSDFLQLNYLHPTFFVLISSLHLVPLNTSPPSQPFSLCLGPISVFCVPPDVTHPVIVQTENRLSGIALATHQDEDGDTYVVCFTVTVCLLVCIIESAN